jgi:hypothetical protein
MEGDVTEYLGLVIGGPRDGETMTQPYAIINVNLRAPKSNATFGYRHENLKFCGVDYQFWIPLDDKRDDILQNLMLGYRKARA